MTTDDAQIRRLRADIGRFSKTIGVPLTPWQAEALSLRQRTTVVVAPRQTGKSRSLAVAALWVAFRKSDQRVLVVSAGEEASRRLLADVAGSPLLLASVVDEMAGLVTLSTGSEIRSVPASERQIRGWSADLLIGDEASQIPDELLYGAMLPTTAARRAAHIVLASSPGAPEGGFHTFAEQGASGSEDVRTFRWARSDASWISDEAVRSARAHLPAELFAREYDAEFADVGADERVIAREWIEAAQARSLEPVGRAAYGLDVARSGADRSVLMMAVNGVVRERFTVRSNDLMVLAARTQAVLDAEPARVWVDSTGLGAGPLDRLRQLGYDAIGWVAAARARDAGRFVNVKSESWWSVRELFRDGLVDLDPADTGLAAELAAQRYELTSSGKIAMTSKRVLGGPSPDRADAAVIALHAGLGGDIARMLVPKGNIPERRSGNAEEVAVALSRERGGQGMSSPQLRGLPSWQRAIVERQLRRR